MATRYRRCSIRGADDASPRAFNGVGESGSRGLRIRRSWLGNYGVTQTTIMRTSPSNPESKPELTETILEIGAKLFPRRYSRFKDLVLISKLASGHEHWIGDRTRMTGSCSAVRYSTISKALRSTKADGTFTVLLLATRSQPRLTA